MESTDFIRKAQNSIEAIFQDILKNYERSIGSEYYYLTDPSKEHYMFFCEWTSTDNEFFQDKTIDLLIQDGQIHIRENTSGYDMKIELQIQKIKESEIFIPRYPIKLEQGIFTS